MSSSTINPAALLTMIATMENQLNQMKVLLGAEGGIVAVTKKATKAKKEKDPNAAPKEPNVWIKFTQRISALLKGADIDVGAAPISKQFASTLKDEKPYAEWTDEAILAAWPLWTKPEQSKMAVAKAASSDEASVASGEKAAAKRAPMSDEAKEKTAAKRAAAKAAKAEPKAEEAKPKAVEVKAVTVEAKEPAKKTGKAGKTVVAKKEAFTLEQLQDFGEHTHEGTEYGLNVRGDLVNTDGAYVGQWNEKTKAIVKGAAPADWAKVAPGSA